MNKLYFGDCLDVLKKLHKENPKGFIDLIYIDPPFNSKKNYNILFEDADLKDAKAQKEAFADTWSNISYKDTLDALKDVDLNLFVFLDALDRIKTPTSAVSYLTIMAIRIWYMHKILKGSGSFFLHCDANMSHYLKILCDLIFGNKNFRNEIVWHYTGWNKKLKKHFERRSDTILFYAKSGNQKFSSYTLPWKNEAEYIKVRKQKVRRDRDGRKYVLSDAGGGKRVKRYLDEALAYGIPVDNVWDIDKLTSSSQERLGYPTQKPETLLERIIESSSKKGDLIADFFCGCGTTIAVAQRLRRKWLGVDISHLAIGLVERRLLNSYKRRIKGTYEVEGLPKDLAGAKELAAGVAGGRIKFQDWIIETMLGGVHNPKKTADGGWDGHLTFELLRRKEIVLIAVTSGMVTVKNIREFIQVVNKQKASIGVFVCFADKVTKPMQLEAKEQGYYKKDVFGNAYDKLQILTVEDLLVGERIRMPNIATSTFANAQVNKNDNDAEQGTFF